MLKNLPTILGSLYLILILFLVLSGCSTDPNEKANELYVKALEYNQKMRAKSESYSSALESYKKVQAHIDRILSKYPGANLAVGLMSGETRISGLTLSEFRNLESSLKLMAEAEHEPLSCALLFAKTIESELSKAWTLTVIAVECAEAGRFDQALETAKTIGVEFYKACTLAVIAGKYAKAGRFDQALETAKTIGVEFYKARALAELAGKYAEAGQKEKAAQLLSRALETAKTIESKDSKARALAELAGKYAEAGQKEKAAQLLSQALETAKTIEDEFSKAWALVKIAGKYAEAGLKPSQKDVTLLSEMVRIKYPMELFWK
ncbi:MAG: hypothetical protein JRI84_16415 [Deltaproteobacteria bacterium]|nr:hypothetical protein [Deltaproteobacteria bacterium]